MVRRVTGNVVTDYTGIGYAGLSAMFKPAEDRRPIEPLMGLRNAIAELSEPVHRVNLAYKNKLWPDEVFRAINEIQLAVVGFRQQVADGYPGNLYSRVVEICRNINSMPFSSERTALSFTVTGQVVAYAEEAVNFATTLAQFYTSFLMSMNDHGPAAAIARCNEYRATIREEWNAVQTLHAEVSKPETMISEF